MCACVCVCVPGEAPAVLSGSLMLYLDLRFSNKPPSLPSATCVFRHFCRMAVEERLLSQRRLKLFTNPPGAELRVMDLTLLCREGETLR